MAMAGSIGRIQIPCTCVATVTDEVRSYLTPKQSNPNYIIDDTHIPPNTLNSTPVLCGLT